jgi:phospholipid/cholesterol/gamma-HCH transport system substrate-binding protein
MKRNVIETVMGAVVLAVAAFFLFFAYGSSDLSSVDGYEVMARFDRIDGLEPGANVAISGVRVGRVISTQLDPSTYLAEVRMSIASDIELPADTIATVASESLLGGRFMSLDPGGDPTLIEPGGVIAYTQSTPGLEQLIGQFIYGMDSGDSGSSSDAGSSDAPSLFDN